MTIIIGNICNDATTKQVLVSGVPTLVTEFNFAENYSGAGGKRETQYYRISAWGETGAKQAKYLVKGRPLVLEGRVRGRAYLSTKTGKPTCQLEMSNPHITYVTANPTQDVDAVTEGPEMEIPTTVDANDVAFPE
jgi:single-stranded DNA-binding protein